MNDRELLELAAKAAGIVVIRSRLDDPMSGDLLVKASHRNPFQVAGPWNPLAADGDALRLAIKLKITIQFPCDHKCKLMQETRCWNDSDDPAIEEHKDDPYAATRRAIVRAAAEIGRSMK